MAHAITDLFSTWRIHPVAALRRWHRLLKRSPRHAAELLPLLECGERVLARTSKRPQQVIGTDQALHVDNGVDGWCRIPWSGIAAVGWSNADRSLEVRPWAARSTGPPLRFGAHAQFAAFADERVMATRLFYTKAEILPGVFGTVIALRATEDTPVRWQILLDRPEHIDGPTLDDACSRLIAELHGLAGC